MSTLQDSATGFQDWGHLPAVAVQCIGRHCCPASEAKLRAVCRTWHDALTTQFTELHLGPGSPWPGQGVPLQHAAASAATSSGDLVKSFPAVQTLHVTASSTRDYPTTYMADLAHLFCNIPSLRHLTLHELHELEDFDNLDLASLWDALDTAAAAPGGLASRLVGLSVSDCFWNTPELFGVLKQLTGLTQLRLSNNPLETACEVNIIASLTQLKVLEFGLIFDGSSQHHDVPRALEQVSNLKQLQELSIPMWRRSLGGRAHPLAPSLAIVLGKLTGLASLAVDGKFGHLTVVSCLTNLRRLASAAPLSTEGWQAISQLPELTLLTSLTPPAEPLRLNPARPHTGLDLRMLATKHCLQGLDVAVMQPEHLATIGQFTALQSLNLRCASTFEQPQQQAQLLTALSCLPGSLTSLFLGPMLPLSAKLLTTVAKSCPGLVSLSARFTHVSAVASSRSVEDMQPQDLLPQAMTSAGDAVDIRADTDLMHIDSPLDVVDADADSLVAAEGVANSSISVSCALRQLQALTSLELVLMTAEDIEQGPVYGTSGGGGSRRPSTAGSVAVPSAPAVDHMYSISSAYEHSGVQLLLEDLPHRLQRLALSGPWQIGLGQAKQGSPVLFANTSAQQQPCAVCGRSKAAAADVVAADAGSDTLASLCHCLKGLGVSSQMQPQPGSPARPGRPTSGHKRPGSYTQLAAGPGLEASAAAVGSAANTAADVFVLEGSGVLEKRSRSFGSLFVGSSAAASARGTVAAQPQQRQSLLDDDSAGLQQDLVQLPVLSELCLFRCQIAYGALQQLTASARPRLRKLQLLQLQVSQQVGPPVVLSPKASTLSAAAAAARAARVSFTGEDSRGAVWGSSALTTGQLLQLPVVWPHLEEWHVHPRHLWGLLSAGYFDSSASWGMQQHSRESASALQHVSQLLNLRHLYVVDKPASFAAAYSLDKDSSKAEPVTVLPLHDRPAVELLLQQLQQGLQQMPALRQLLLYMGYIAKQQPDLPDNCQDLWAEAGERLLSSLPACRVKHHSPTVCGSQYQVGNGNGLLVPARVHGGGSGLKAGGHNPGLWLSEAGAVVYGQSSDQVKADSGVHPGEAAAAEAPLPAIDEQYIEDYVI